ncbi:MAG: hypothetical protein U0V56_05370 [Actinomycetota bacterium]
MSDFASAGGTCIVDLTNIGISPAPEHLKTVSEMLDVHVVAGCGYYVHRTHRPWLEDASVEHLAETIERDVTEGLGETGIRPGIIGEIGTSGEWYDCEERALRAAARAAVPTRHCGERPYDRHRSARATDRRRSRGGKDSTHDGWSFRTWTR